LDRNLCCNYICNSSYCIPF